MIDIWSVDMWMDVIKITLVAQVVGCGAGEQLRMDL